MKIAIAGATGNVGKSIVKELSKTNHNMVLLIRDLNVAKISNHSNFILRETNILNSEEVISATQDCDVLFWMVPPILSLSSMKEVYDKVIFAGVSAVVKNNIKRVVLISSLGADKGSGLGTVSYVGEMETEFKRVCKNVMALRPGYFMENFLLQKDSILNKGFFSFPFEEDHKIPFISADDIGFEAAKYLVNNDWKGHLVKNLMGPKNLTCKEIEKIFTKIFNKSIVYQKSSYRVLRKEFSTMGLNTIIQEEFCELLKALGDKNGIYAIPRTSESFTPTTLEDVITRKIKNGF